MSLLDDIARVRVHLEQNGRVSYRVLKREFGLDDEGLEDILDELVDMQQVAVREEKGLSWRGAQPIESQVPLREIPAPNSYTPKHLAEKILQSRSALEGERKRVTVLFADVKSSMDLAGQLGAEDWHTILDRFFSILNDGIHRFEGTINQYTGDGIMALFGAPIAHEDHAQRACYAALQLRDELRRFSVELRVERGIDFSTRIGINSGEVIVGKIGDDLRMDYTAQGHTVGMAQRLESIAESGHIYTSEHTARLVEGYFNLTDLGAAQLAGVENPVGVFDLESTTAARTRLDVSRSRGLTRFVGRVDEMQSLESALARARQGHGQVVGVVGEPGLGKSRLCFEFVERCRAQDLPVYEAHCPSHGKLIPFIPILALFRSYFDISDQDSPGQTRQKIAGALVLIDPDLHPGLPVLFEFLGVDDPNNPAPSIDPDARQRQLFEIVHKISRVQNERKVASVIFIDDLHWIDDWSDEFVAQMVEATQASHTLLLVNFRPEYQAAWTVKPHYQQLPLIPLGEEAVREMVASLLGDDESVLPLTERIMQWTGGNPLFSEEVINTLLETGQLTGARGAYKVEVDLDALQVPATVQSIIAARIDRLDENSKQLLHTAAVVGKEFSRQVIERITDLAKEDLSSAIERLKGLDFVYETSLYPTIEYSFKHPLVHEVAYETQLKDQRATRHQQVAETTEHYASEHLDEVAAMLAYHWERAARIDKSLHWHRHAALVLALSDLGVAQQHWRKIRQLVDKADPTNEALSFGAEACASLNAIGWRLGGSEEASHAYFEDGKEMAERAGNNVLLSTMNGSYASFRGVTLGDAGDYARFADEAVRIAKLTGNNELQCAMQAYQAWGYIFSGRIREGVDVAQSAVAQIPADIGYGAAYMGGMPAAWAAQLAAGSGLWLIGEAELGLETLRVNLPAISTHPDFRFFSEAVAGYGLGIFGDFDEAVTLGKNAMSKAEAMGSAYSRASFAGFLGSTQYRCGDIDDAARSLKYAVALMDGEKTAGGMSNIIVGCLALAEVALGDAESARARAEACVAFSEKRGLYWTLEPWFALAGANIALGNDAEALAALQKSDQLIEKTGSVIFQPYLHEERANFAAAFLSDWDQADELRTAHRLFTELRAPGQADRIAQKLN